MYGIEVRDAAGALLAMAEGEREVALAYHAAYRAGDRLLFRAPGPHATVCVDQAVAAAPVYLPDLAFAFAVPFGDLKAGYPPQAFSGEAHLLTIGPVSPDTLVLPRNIALNPFDQRPASGCFPHAGANVETRDEAQFFARNAIDGHRCNARHGPWPYHSWGIGERRDAWLEIDFGRPVRVWAVALTLRADWPHDAWWEKGEIACSDGYAFSVRLQKVRDAQRFEMPERVIRRIRLFGLVKAEDPSPYPALTQFEVFGKDVG